MVQVDIYGGFLQGKPSARAPRPCRRKSAPAWRSWTTWRRWAALNSQTSCCFVGRSDLRVCGFMFSGLSEGAAEPLPAGLRQPHRGAEPVPEGGLGLRPEGQSPEDRHPGKAAATQTQFPLWFRTSALRVCPPLQCSKLLSDTAVIQFYPSKFVLITDILDTFGGRDKTFLLPFTCC